MHLSGAVTEVGNRPRRGILYHREAGNKVPISNSIAEKIQPWNRLLQPVGTSAQTLSASPASDPLGDGQRATL